MRGLVLGLVMLPGGALADVFDVVAPPGVVVVHPDVARIGREAVVDMPVGRHVIRLSDLPSGLDAESLRVGLDGARLTSRTLRDRPLPTAAWLEGSEEVQRARAGLETAREALAVHDDRARALDARIAAAEAQVAFLDGLGSIEGLAGDVLDAAQFRLLGQAIFEDGAAARAAILADRSEKRRLEPERKLLEDALTLAQATYDRVVSPRDRAREVELAVTVAEAGPVTLSLDYLVNGAGWAPRFRLHLDDDSGALSVVREVEIYQETGEAWESVMLSVTTLPVRAQAAPSELWPQLLRIEDPGNVALRQGVSVSRMSADAPETDFLAEAQATPRAVFSGAGVRYDFATPVQVLEGERAAVALAPLTFDTELTARAVPSRDQTAFRNVALTNESGERILGGEAELVVDGATVGRTRLATIEAREAVDLSFGPIYGLQLRRAILDREEGDRGIISRENQQQEAARLVVENLTDREWAVTVVDQVPYGEQEDLVIAWQAYPEPNRENVEDQRGILEWDFNIAAGETREVRLQTDIRWPEGQILR